MVRDLWLVRTDWHSMWTCRRDTNFLLTSFPFLLQPSVKKIDHSISEGIMRARNAKGWTQQDLARVRYTGDRRTSSHRKEIIPGYDR